MSINKGLSSALIKNPGKTETYTEHELEELGKCLDPHHGLLHFAENYTYIQHPVRGRVKFEPYDYQRKVLQAFNENDYVITMQSRQLGKCQTYDTRITVDNNQIPIGKLLWNKMSLRQRIVTMLERWLISLLVSKK